MLEHIALNTLLSSFFVLVIIVFDRGLQKFGVANTFGIEKDSLIQVIATLVVVFWLLMVIRFLLSQLC